VSADEGRCHGLPTAAGSPHIEDVDGGGNGKWQPGGNSPQGSGGVEEASGDSRDSQASQADRSGPKHKALMDDLMGQLSGEPIRQGDLAKRVGRKPSDGTFRRALARLERDGRAAKTPEGWV